VKISGYKQRCTIWGIYTVLIAVASLAPSSSFKDTPSFLHADKIIHFIMYGAQAVLLLWALTPKLRKITTRVILTILFCSAYGILMEILQAKLQPNDRTFSIGDIIANIAGATCLSLIMIRRKPTK